jgi:hypothetical protein
MMFILIIVCHCSQAQNDDFSVIFNLEDYKGRYPLFFSIRLNLIFILHLVKKVKSVFVFLENMYNVYNTRAHTHAHTYF